MTDFEQRVVDQLGELTERTVRVEAKLDNGLVGEIRSVRQWIEDWTKGHPRECPLEKRRNTYVIPVTVAVLTAVALKVIDAVVKL